MTTPEAMRKALEALKLAQRDGGPEAFYATTDEKINEAIAALESVLAAPVQEPTHDERARRIADCLRVLRPAVRRMWPHEQALEELAGFAASPVQPAAPQPALIRAFNTGYMLGHHDTVEGQFTDIDQRDMDTYHCDVVAELDLPAAPQPIEHVCGLQGYNGMIDPPCPACEERHGITHKAQEDADGVRVISHHLSQETAGEGNMQTITPVCSCGWRGVGVAAYNDDQLALVKQQEFGHMRDLQRGTAGRK